MTWLLIALVVVLEAALLLARRFEPSGRSSQPRGLGGGAPALAGLALLWAAIGLYLEFVYFRV
jgi:hypothetical protein